MYEKYKVSFNLAFISNSPSLFVIVPFTLVKLST